ncbi:MAG: helix-turn-helix transcriptional regulator [Deinococcota bacterium]
MASSKRKTELASFLRSRRERLTPDRVGLQSSGRRRTPGLRREEVAELAGIGTTWYTWLEQGRNVQASSATLEQLVHALQLNPEERRHLYRLARNEEPVEPQALIIPQEHVPDELRIILESLSPQPSYILGKYWDILAWNQVASQVFTDFAKLPQHERNIVYYMFTHDRPRQELVQWNSLARVLVAQYRVTYDYLKSLGDSRIEQLTQTFCAQSKTFRQLWSKHEIKTDHDGEKTFIHRDIGRLQLRHSTLQWHRFPDLRLVVYSADHASETYQKLRTLAARSLNCLHGDS